MSGTTWWQHGVVYQIYPRSFQDSDGDGVGDLKGIVSRLDHLTDLGVDALWVSPIYPSPMADFGYDVADYCDVEPLFGTLADMDALIAAAHERGLKVILDFVPNHSSDQHPWFRESRSSRDNPKRDWYIWRDGKQGGPPNNWQSNFGGDAWEWDEASGQYYYHAFLKEQPDLNWRNPELRAAMLDVLRFWLDRGVDGFRVDVIWHLIKDAEFRDNPDNPTFEPHHAGINRYLQVHSADQPEVHDVIAEMRAVLDAYEGDRVLIGEIYLPVERLVAYYGKDLSGAHLPFNFQLIQAEWNARGISRLVEEYESAIPQGGWPNWVLGNHDQPRIAARVGEAQARVAAMLLLTLRGTPTIYYGDEIGLARVEIPPDRVQDPWELNEPGLGFNRDPERTPMQWDAGPKAGFTEGEPWLPLSEDRSTRNVENLNRDESSILTLHQRLLQLRKAHSALAVGDYRSLDRDGEVMAFERADGQERMLIVLNFGHQDRREELPHWAANARIVLSTHLDREGERAGKALDVRPNEGIVLIA